MAVRDDHSSGTRLAARLARPTRTSERECSCIFRCGRPYSVLLPVGFTLPPLLPGARCALAAPFRPCPRAALRRLRGRCVFCGTVPGVAPAGGYPAPYSRGARTFLCRLRDSGRPAVWRRHKSADAASGSRPRMEVVLRRSQAAAGRHGRFAAPCRLRGLTPWDLNAGPNPALGFTRHFLWRSMAVLDPDTRSKGSGDA